MEREKVFSDSFFEEVHVANVLVAFYYYNFECFNYVRFT